MVNTINQGDCEIQVEFDVGTKQYKIIRGIKQRYLKYINMVNL